MCDLNQRNDRRHRQRSQGRRRRSRGLHRQRHQQSQINDMVADVKARFGRIDVLVNNAGIGKTPS